ncbi:hypothetical protein ASF27_14720 [Methylobacterium sp. Leaf102]|uniref:helix-turn-helix domain-containing protein n=1 Tax=Methylobacterium sp. Leaf102 TaxID=1736253 RepID=UPI0006F8AC3A|nr:helix-turn-helix transcriptional regulator [Methylobacterium sp. Leaf102]KQP21827.1 hypothetical protein ASF27_14720 [Methylobacterium sp. Leaf102]
MNLTMPRQPENEDRAVAERMVVLRKARGLSQSAIALVLGVTFQQVQKYENGTNRITADRLAKLAAQFEVPITAFFGESDQSEPITAGLSSLLSLDGADELVRAYAQIETPETRRVVLSLVRALAGLR